jgi:hypothetical protein
MAGVSLAAKGGHVSGHGTPQAIVSSTRQRAIKTDSGRREAIMTNAIFQQLGSRSRRDVIHEEWSIQEILNGFAGMSVRWALPTWGKSSACHHLVIDFFFQVYRTGH